MGLWISYAFVAAAFALMGRIVYSTHRKSPTETVEESESFGLGRFDAVDVLLVLVTWFAFPVVLGSWFADFMAARNVGLAFFAGAAAGAVWLRRRWFPDSVIRFDPKNAALRSASMFCGIGAPITLLFGFVAGWLEKPSSTAWSFFLMAAGLAVLAAWFHALEFRRRPGQSSEVPAPREMEAEWRPRAYEAEQQVLAPAEAPSSKKSSAKWERLKKLAIALVLWVLAGLFFHGAWSDWRLERSLDTGGIRTEALVTSCTATRSSGNRLDYSFEIQTFHGSETVTGHGFASCDNLGKKIAIRYLEADPFVSQLDRPWPWAFAFLVGLVLTLAALPLIWPALGDRAAHGLMWCICLIVTTNFAANGYMALAGIEEITSEQLFGVVVFAVVFNPYPFYLWVRKRMKARKEASSAGQNASF